MQGRRNVFEHGGGNSFEFKQKYKFANRENPYPGGWSWGTCKHLLRLRFHCEFPDFHLIFYLLPKRGGGNSKIVQFSICKLEKKFNARKIGAPFPPSSPLFPFQPDATCLFWFFFTVFRYLKRKK